MICSKTQHLAQFYRSRIRTRIQGSHFPSRSWEELLDPALFPNHYLEGIPSSLGSIPCFCALLIYFFPQFKTRTLQPGHSWKVKVLNKSSFPAEEEKREFPDHLSPSWPLRLPLIFCTLAQTTLRVWRDNHCQILHSKILDFIRKSCNSLTTVHQALQHATTWPAESLWTCHLTLCFYFLKFINLHEGILLSV